VKPIKAWAIILNKHEPYVFEHFYNSGIPLLFTTREEAREHCFNNVRHACIRVEIREVPRKRKGK
jgi:hypothetical protein